MRDLRKVVYSAVFSVPHSKEIVQMPTIRMLAHPYARHFRRGAECVSHLYRERMQACYRHAGAS